MLKKAIQFPFRGPNVWPNLGCMALSMIIPVVGGLVATGYLIVIEKKLIENINSDAPRFNFNRFADYLIKGLWPFLASLVLSLFIMPLTFGLAVAMMLAVALLHENEGLMVGAIVCGGFLIVLVSLLIGPPFQALYLNVSLQGDFKAAFDWRFALDYTRRVGLLYIGKHLLLMLIFFPLAIFSFCIPYLGMFALMTISMFVFTHLNIQIYLEYLNRGGTPIPFQPEPIEPAFPVVPAPQPQPPAPYP